MREHGDLDRMAGEEVRVSRGREPLMEGLIGLAGGLDVGLESNPWVFAQGSEVGA